MGGAEQSRGYKPSACSYEVRIRCGYNQRRYAQNDTLRVEPGQVQNSDLLQHPLNARIEPINRYLPRPEMLEPTVRFPASTPGHKHHTGSGSEPSPVDIVLLFCTVVDKGRNRPIECTPELLVGDEGIILFLRRV